MRSLRRALIGGLGGAALLLTPVHGQSPVQDRPSATFRSGVSLVSVNAVVKDRRGRPVRNLTRDDFTVLENGANRPIVDFGFSDQGAVSFGVLIDQSGSMTLSNNLDAAREVIRHLVAWFDAGRDEIALFAFDKQLRDVQPFTTDADAITAALPRLTAYGTTALYDAIASTAEQLETRPSPRRALIVVTDGLDTASTKTAEDVSAIASAIDVPVYVVVVMSPANHPDHGGIPLRQGDAPITTRLANLAYWTGGDMLIASTPAETSQAARRLVTDLRHQYQLAFESSSRAGWHELAVRTRNPDLQVRARSGYIAQPSSHGN
ncbi:VWA domain-containing protein [Luteitalea sp.]|uniref:VWA domain-containing protein n=1 Tax=Luteitalea sp. TaxID=2004800 RepID=UPI0037CB9F6D